ncbi:MAG: hypothetical protein ABFC88_12410 [Thermoguttaceae bacterium]
MRHILAALTVALLFAGMVAAEATPSQTLIKVGRETWKVKSILTGKQHPVLQREAERHAKEQADHQMQGHFWWDQRKARIIQQVPGLRSVEEVCNESWPGQNTNDAAYEMYRSWKTSDGHWASVNSPCTYYGYAMALGKNGVWYACGIVAQKGTGEWDGQADQN